MNMNPDRFRLLSPCVCLCLSLSLGITIKSASRLLQGEPGGKMFCILSLMPQKLNALITSDLRWSALVTVPLHIFDLIHTHPANLHMHARTERAAKHAVRTIVSFLWAGFLFVHINVLKWGAPSHAECLRSKMPASSQISGVVGGTVLDPSCLCLRGFYIFTTPSALSKRSCSNPHKSRLHWRKWLCSVHKRRPCVLAREALRQGARCPQAASQVTGSGSQLGRLCSRRGRRQGGSWQTPGSSPPTTPSVSTPVVSVKTWKVPNTRDDTPMVECSHPSSRMQNQNPCLHATSLWKSSSRLSSSQRFLFECVKKC